MVGSPSNGFEGKVVLVTGAASGIGRETALEFAGRGARVVVSDVSPSGEDTAAEIERGGGEALFVKCDVSKSSDVRELIRHTVERFRRLDIAVNNAGIDPEVVAAAEWDEDVFARTIAVNLQGIFLCMKYEIVQMLTQDGGAIVNVASLAGLVASPTSRATPPASTGSWASPRHRHCNMVLAGFA
jgi:NAD(P)-dependent dehydrogenase (short-subunit alcohol dehydrogenase family)